MRLTCPNCDARYEVPDEVMPISGRDVQCSNCGQTWFQHHPDHAPPDDEEDVALPPDTMAPDEEVSPPPPPAPREPVPERRQLDPAVADILRQEAEAEFEARQRRKSEPLESQPDLGLDTADDPQPPLRKTGADTHATEPEAERRAEDARRRMARMRGEPDPEPGAEATAAAAAISSRRELLPDIEEINSTLRSDTSPSGVDPDAREDLGAGGEVKIRRSGFRRGFSVMILLFAVLVAIYVFAPDIARAVPAVDPFLNSYVAWVDQSRMALNGQVTAFLTWLNDAASQSGG